MDDKSIDCVIAGPGVYAELHPDETFQVIVRYDRTGQGPGRSFSLHSEFGSFRARLARILPGHADADAVAQATWERLSLMHAERSAERAGRVHVLAAAVRRE